MKTKKILLIPALGLLASLGACDGYEMTKVDNYFPYGNQRTAGSGVAYVVAKMMPKKEMKLDTAGSEMTLKPVKRQMKAAPIVPESDTVLEDMRKMFQEKQRK